MLCTTISHSFPPALYVRVSTSSNYQLTKLSPKLALFTRLDFKLLLRKSVTLSRLSKTALYFSCIQPSCQHEIVAAAAASAPPTPSHATPRHHSAYDFLLSRIVKNPSGKLHKKKEGVYSSFGQCEGEQQKKTTMQTEHYSLDGIASQGVSKSKIQSLSSTRRLQCGY